MTSMHADEAYLNHYRFSHDPFAARVPGFKFFPAQRKPVLGQLHHLARYSQLLLVVSGPEGSGKTLLRQALVASTNKQSVTSVVASGRGALDSGALLAQIGQGLGTAHADIEAVQAQVEQLALTGQETYLLVDDAEELRDDALETLLILAQGSPEARAHVFLFGEPDLVARLEDLAAGEERFHAIELQPYSEDETREYLSQRLEGAGRGIELFSEEQIQDIQEQSQGWPGSINEVARQLLIDGMLSQRSSGKRGGMALKIPKKHLVALAVVAIGVLAAWLMQGRTEKTAAPETAQLPLGQSAQPSGTPGQAGSAEGGSPPAIEFSGNAKPLPLPLTNDAQPVIRQPLAQAAGDESVPEPGPADEESAPPAARTQPPPAVAVTPAPAAAPVAPAAAPPVTAAPTPARTPAPVAASSQASAPSTAGKATAKAEPPQQKAAAPATGAPAGGADAWYRGQSGSNFAVQILGTGSEAKAKALVQSNGGQYRYYRKLYQGKPLYVVTYGDFPNRDAAEAAIKSLPAELKSGKPWPKSFASIQQELGK
jgi:DamX protein